MPFVFAYNQALLTAFLHSMPFGWLRLRHRGRDITIALVPPIHVLQWVKGRYPDTLLAN